MTITFDRRSGIIDGQEEKPIAWSLDQRTYDRLVRYCWSLTRNVDAAEDLASETLLEGCRQAWKLTDADGIDRWLFAIARHVCLRWRRRRGRDVRSVPFGDQHEALIGDRGYDVDRVDIDTALADALSSLPKMTRSAFLLRYLDGASHAEIAARIGLSEAAVSMRISRARAQLRQLLEAGMRPEDRVPDSVRRTWRETRLWCSRCGMRQQQICCDDARGIVAFRCPACDDDPGRIATELPLSNAHFARLFGGLRQPAAISRRIDTWVNDYFRRALEAPSIACTHCGQPATVIRSMPEVSATIPRDQPGMHVRCDHCLTICSSSLSSLVMALPEVSAFRRSHRRVRTLPLHEIEAAGQPAVQVSIESVGSQSRIDVLSARDTFVVLGIHRSCQVLTC